MTDELPKHGKILGVCNTNSHFGACMSLLGMADILHFAITFPTYTTQMCSGGVNFQRCDFPVLCCCDREKLDSVLRHHDTTFILSQDHFHSLLPAWSDPFPERLPFPCTVRINPCHPHHTCPCAHLLLIQKVLHSHV